MKKFTARQHPVTAMAVVGSKHIGTDNGLLVHLPAGALVTHVFATVAEAFDSGTNATLTVEDSAGPYINAHSLTTAGDVASAVTTKWYPTGDTLKFSLAGTEMPNTPGKAIVAIQYVQEGRSSEVQG